MPFNQSNAAEYGRMGGLRRWINDNHERRDKDMHIKMTEAEHERLSSLARTYRCTRAELIIAAVEALHAQQTSFKT